MPQPYRYLAVLEGPDIESAAPLIHTEDAEFIALVLRLFARHLRRASHVRRPVPTGRLRIVEGGEPDGRGDDGRID